LVLQVRHISVSAKTFLMIFAGMVYKVNNSAWNLLRARNGPNRTMAVKEQQTSRRWPVKRERLDSSSLASAGYDPAAHVLEVEFHNGGVYQYLEVEDEEYQEFRTAPSKGRYLNAEIKPGHRARRLSPPRRRR
jgi:hypothetical protein